MKVDKQFEKQNITVYPYTKIIGRENITFGHDIIIDDFVFISARMPIKFGNFVHIGCFSSIAGGGSLVMGDYTSLSHGCRVFTATDDFKEWGFGNPTVPRKYRNVKMESVSIGKFCVVGANSVILPGVTIGEGATVGASSVVTRDLDPWGVYIGNKKIKERNKEAVLENYSKYLDDIEQHD